MAVAHDDQRPRDLHSRLVATAAGRAAAAIAIIVVGFWIVAPNTPAGPFRDRVDMLWQPATNIGLTQDWSIFSPNPRSRSLDLYAIVGFDDGTTERWDVPDFDPLTGALRQYRWHKWQDRVRLDSRSDLWEATAVWIAGRHGGDGRPVEVRLVRRWRVHEPLTDDGAETGEWMEFEFYVWTGA